MYYRLHVISFDSRTKIWNIYKHMHNKNEMWIRRHEIACVLVLCSWISYEPPNFSMPQPPNRRGMFLPYNVKSKLKNACSAFGQALEHEKCKVFAPGSEMCGKRSCRNWCVSAIDFETQAQQVFNSMLLSMGGAEFGNCPHGCFVPGPWHWNDDDARGTVHVLMLRAIRALRAERQSWSSGPSWDSG